MYMGIESAGFTAMNVVLFDLYYVAYIPISMLSDIVA